MVDDSWQMKWHMARDNHLFLCWKKNGSQCKRIKKYNLPFVIRSSTVELIYIIITQEKLETTQWYVLEICIYLMDFLQFKTSFMKLPLPRSISLRRSYHSWNDDTNFKSLAIRHSSRQTSERNSSIDLWMSYRYTVRRRTNPTVHWSTFPRFWPPPNEKFWEFARWDATTNHITHLTTWQIHIHAIYSYTYLLSSPQQPVPYESRALFWTADASTFDLVHFHKLRTSL